MVCRWYEPVTPSGVEAYFTFLLSYAWYTTDDHRRPTAAGGEHVGSCCRRRSTTWVVSRVSGIRCRTCVARLRQLLRKSSRAWSGTRRERPNAPRPPRCIWMTDPQAEVNHLASLTLSTTPATSHSPTTPGEGYSLITTPAEVLAELGCAVRAVCRLT